MSCLWIIGRIMQDLKKVYVQCHKLGSFSVRDEISAACPCLMIDNKIFLSLSFFIQRLCVCCSTLFHSSTRGCHYPKRCIHCAIGYTLSLLHSDCSWGVGYESISDVCSSNQSGVGNQKPIPLPQESSVCVYVCVCMWHQLIHHHPCVRQCYAFPPGFFFKHI